VIRYRVIGYVLGQFLTVLGLMMLVPGAYGVVAGQGGTGEMLVGALAAAVPGALLWRFNPRPSRDLTQREALLLVCAIWVGSAAFGGLPFYLSPHFASFTDAFFEAASGFTTTGATVLPRVEVLPPPVQFWRHFTHWLGGMGIVLLGIAILPLVGHGGAQLYRAEFSGARSEKLKPRLAETAAALWRIYAALTLLEIVALQLAGMSLFEAACHTFSTLGTGGFSTRTASVAAFDSLPIEIIIVVFMLLSGMSFIQHYRAWVEGRPRSVLADGELVGYLAIAAAATLVIGLVLTRTADLVWPAALRQASFQVVSIMTTTGFVTADFEVWHPLPQVILLVLMFVGGCTGSTAGGFKVARVLPLGKVVHREFKRMVERRGVFAVRLGGQPVREEAIQGLLSLVHLALLVNFAAVVALAALGVDLVTAISGVAATMFNVGPGLGAVGPSEHYGHLPALAKWVLSGCMIAGRLEFYTLLVVVTPAFWRR
jgi:trk system potassium uptake protein TrkH